MNEKELPASFRLDTLATSIIRGLTERKEKAIAEARRIKALGDSYFEEGDLQEAGKWHRQALNHWETAATANAEIIAMQREFIEDLEPELASVKWAMVDRDGEPAEVIARRSLDHLRPHDPSEEIPAEIVAEYQRNRGGVHKGVGEGDGGLPPATHCRHCGISREDWIHDTGCSECEWPAPKEQTPPTLAEWPVDVARRITVRKAGESIQD